MILYYSTKFHLIVINRFRVIGRGHFPPIPPPPPPQAEPPSKSPGGIGLKLSEWEGRFSTASLLSHLKGQLYTRRNGFLHVKKLECLEKAKCDSQLVIVYHIARCNGKKPLVCTREDTGYFVLNLSSVCNFSFYILYYFTKCFNTREYEPLTH